MYITVISLQKSTILHNINITVSSNVHHQLILGNFESCFGSVIYFAVRMLAATLPIADSCTVWGREYTYTLS